MDGAEVTPDSGTGGLTEWTETGVTSSQSHQFTVSAINSRGEGPQSSPEVTIIAGTVPSMPLNLRKNSASISQITIDWDLPATDGDSPITDYEVWWDSGAENGLYTQATDSTGNSLTFTRSSGLLAGVTYSFKVRAINDVGESDFSEVLEVIAGTIPGQTPTPTKFSADINHIEIRWEAASDGGSDITDYKVYWDSGDGSGVLDYKGSTSGYMTFTVTAADDSIVGGETYVFAVSALNAIGEGTQSESVSIIAATVPS